MRVAEGCVGRILASAAPAFELYGGTRWAWISYSARKKTLKVYLSDSKRKPGRPLIRWLHGD